MGKVGRGRITEQSLYPAIKSVFKEKGAKSVTEERFNTQPDLVAEWLGEKWIVSVKIGEPLRNVRLLKDALVQYTRHMIDSGISYGMIIFYPEKIRKIEPSEDVIENAVRTMPAYFLVLNPQMELRKPLPEALTEIMNVLRKKLPVHYSLPTVISLLKEHVEELMEKIELDERLLLKIISSPDLFFGLSPGKRSRKDLIKVSSFLAAYIFLTQVLFLRLYHEERPTFLRNINVRKIKRADVKKLFEKIKEVNYRPIFDIDVLDIIHENLIRKTFELLFSLQVRKIRYDLPGRLFHELMPREIRKLLAAFYTRPIAAYILALLTIDDPNAVVLDPACGSGTILTMAYRRKAELWEEKGYSGSPHKRFCQEQIYGCDIMPFAVHLTNANLAAMNPLETLEYTQIALGDSLKLAPSKKVEPGFITLTNWMPGVSEERARLNVFNRLGETIEIELKPVDVILMNPPFTKVERGIKKYIDTKFEDRVGGEVGLWGHFIALADVFLKDNGILGAVLPINLLRGRESKVVRRIIFQNWLPLYIIKPSLNYGFTEYAEYRDIIVVAKKTRERPKDHKVKFCIIKKDLNKLTEDEARWIVKQIKCTNKLRSDLLDIDSYPLSYVNKHFDNMMPLISGPSLEAKDALHRIIEVAEKLLNPFPPNYFSEGYGPRPRGSSDFMFITRPINEGRIEKSFLILEDESKNEIVAKTKVGLQKFRFKKSHFLPSLRTPTGIDRIDVTKVHDYVAKEPYEHMDAVMTLCEFKKERLPANYWEDYIKREYRRSTTHLAVVRRINPYSPNQMLVAHYSEKPLIVADLFHAVNEPNNDRAKAVATLLNSIFFLAYLFYLKEETTGRYTELRQYDLHIMKLFPSKREQINNLLRVYNKYKDKKFPALRTQLDINYDERYEWFWKQERGEADAPANLPPIKPHKLRLEFDMDVIKALGADLTRKDVLKAYEAIIQDMIVTRGLRKD